MTNLGKTFLMFLEDESGATAIEYGLIAALMAVASIVSFTALGNGLQNIFGSTSSGVGGAIADAVSNL
ncbi:MAG: Flp family type IVb pilin [Devosiaceae bacterium]|nr:Flp family type IVb pilin [Devosiaceae bacterium]